ncbi:MAG: 30S ribosome-binding factor RbfA [Acidimicrobiia bacterium]
MARARSQRMRKVNELVREIVADSVKDLKDPRVGFLTITGIETSPDLHHAVVFYSVLGSDEEKTATAAALASARSRIQRAVGTQSSLRFTPKLEFRVDPAIDEGLKIAELLRRLESDNPLPDDDADSRD